MKSSSISVVIAALAPAARALSRPPALAAALLGAVACGSPAEGPHPSQRQQDLIGGRHANSPALAHTGALVVIDPVSGEAFPFCSSTLIGPETVVTAKHCALVLPDAEADGFGLAWAPGPQASSSERIPVVAADSAPGDVGGFVRMGRDVAVVHLEFPTEIEPAIPRLFTDALVGQRMVTIGYGVYSAGFASDDQRRIGRETVSAAQGLVFEAMFGSFENFVEWFFTGEVTDSDFLAEFPPDDPFLDQLRVEYDALILFDQHEAVTGLGVGDTQSCYGDSGGPLARALRDGTWETYGVVSGGLSSARSACDFGTVFSTFGPVTLSFLEQSRNWVDPCGDVTEAGECDGDVARRCETSFIGNLRRLEEKDCTALGLTCVAGARGVGCGTAPEPEVADPPGPGDIESLLDTVQESFRPEIARSVPWAARD